MKISVITTEESTGFECKSIDIELNEHTIIHIKVNSFGELVINKTNFGKGDSALIIKPSVSNEIRIS